MDDILRIVGPVSEEPLVCQTLSLVSGSLRAALLALPSEGFSLGVKFLPGATHHTGHPMNYPEMLLGLSQQNAEVARKFFSSGHQGWKNYLRMTGKGFMGSVNQSLKQQFIRLRNSPPRPGQPASQHSEQPWQAMLPPCLPGPQPCSFKARPLRPCLHGSEQETGSAQSSSRWYSDPCGKTKGLCSPPPPTHTSLRFTWGALTPSLVVLEARPVAGN